MNRAISSAVGALRGGIMSGGAHAMVGTAASQRLHLVGARKMGGALVCGVHSRAAGSSVSEGGNGRGMQTRAGNPFPLALSLPLVHHRGIARSLLATTGLQHTRALSTHEYFDSAGRTIDPPSDKNNPIFLPWRAFRTWYTLYRLRNDNFAGVSFRDADFLAEAEKMYAEFAGAAASGDRRRIKTHVTEKIAGKIKRQLPEKEKKKGGDKGPKHRVHVSTSGAKIVQARLVYFTQPQGHCFAQIICDINVASDTPHVKRVVFDRAMHLGYDGKWLISEIS